LATGPKLDASEPEPDFDDSRAADPECSASIDVEIVAPKIGTPKLPHQMVVGGLFFNLPIPKPISRLPLLQIPTVKDEQGGNPEAHQRNEMPANFVALLLVQNEPSPAGQDRKKNRSHHIRGVIGARPVELGYFPALLLV
jgi:hypothetical protein